MDNHISFTLIIQGENREKELTERGTRKDGSYYKKREDDTHDKKEKIIDTIKKEEIANTIKKA